MPSINQACLLWYLFYMIIRHTSNVIIISVPPFIAYSYALIKLDFCITRFIWDEFEFLTAFELLFVSMIRLFSQVKWQIHLLIPTFKQRKKSVNANILISSNGNWTKSFPMREMTYHLKCDIPLRRVFMNINAIFILYFIVLAIQELSPLWLQANQISYNES